ncbi:50S ribosomal protein L21 [endosymbiont of Sipalinus gigas]|uniref:50S ribosomal protein L21 n=1 Tax=endosymbiont of Sipalinus gigas TaxID=1972134 RepID=UPI000DC72636|nr:50S ribosomal protein L21 [endosymbiont of Sipalinus gigas]BBA85368.1 50S ribosomal protein L21 [endosymbiont of Sipalinus gigas]
MYVIFQFNNKQYISKDNQILKVDKINLNINSEIEINNLILLNYNNKLFIGNPFIKNIKIIVKIINHIRTKKIKILKFKRRKNYLKINNHRQWFTNIKIKNIIEV